MTNYTLTVFHEGESVATTRLLIERAADVLSAITSLLESHPECFRIHVDHNGTHLFSVDCRGDSVTD